MNFPEDDGTDEGGIVRCECGRAVPCRHCPTPIDPADIRPGDVVERRDRIAVHSLATRRSASLSFQRRAES